MKNITSKEFIASVHYRIELKRSELLRPLKGGMS